MSLGQGLSVGAGIAQAARLNGIKHFIYVLLGDGACNKRSVWEALQILSQLYLDNLITIVYVNHLQGDENISGGDERI